MDKSVKRVTVVEGSAENRQAKVIYENPGDIDESTLPPLERAVRHIVSAALIGAQVAYDTYLKRAAEGKADWVFQPRGKDTQADSAAAAKRAPGEDGGDLP